MCALRNLNDMLIKLRGRSQVRLECTTTDVRLAIRGSVYGPIGIFTTIVHLRFPLICMSHLAGLLGVRVGSVGGRYVSRRYCSSYTSFNSSMCA